MKKLMFLTTLTVLLPNLSFAATVEQRLTSLERRLTQLESKNDSSWTCAVPCCRSGFKGTLSTKTYSASTLEEALDGASDGCRDLGYVCTGLDLAKACVKGS